MTSQARKDLEAQFAIGIESAAALAARGKSVCCVISEDRSDGTVIVRMHPEFLGRLQYGTELYVSAAPQPAQQAEAEPIATLESVLCDPSGKCSIKGSDADRAIVESALAKLKSEVAGCFEAAIHEGLIEALAETTDERLKDLVERRLMYALYAAQAPQTAQHPTPRYEPTDEGIGND